MFGFNIDQNDKRTLLYILIMLILSASFGYVLYLFTKYYPEKLPSFYIVLQFIFLILGIFHVWFMYNKLFWSKRDIYDFKQDSLLPETIFTILIASLMCIITLALFGFLTDFSKITVYWALSISFLIPFLLLKSFDFLGQIPHRDFSQKWQFTNNPIKEDHWNWENEIWVNFELKEKWIRSRQEMNRSASFRIMAPRKVPIREIFRLAIREYNRKRPDIVVQDLGFEKEINGMFWWLFSIKFNWKQPGTWFRKPRYLDPYISPVANGIHPKDIILARRMSTEKAFDNKEDYFDGDVAMGELVE